MPAWNTLRKELSRQGAYDGTLDQVQMMLADLQERADTPPKVIERTTTVVKPDTASLAVAERLRNENEALGHYVGTLKEQLDGAMASAWWGCRICMVESKRLPDSLIAELNAHHAEMKDDTWAVGLCGTNQIWSVNTVEEIATICHKNPDTQMVMLGIGEHGYSLAANYFTTDMARLCPQLLVELAFGVMITPQNENRHTAAIPQEAT